MGRAYWDGGRDIITVMFFTYDGQEEDRSMDVIVVIFPATGVCSDVTLAGQSELEMKSIGSEMIRVANF